MRGCSWSCRLRHFSTLGPGASSGPTSSPGGCSRPAGSRISASLAWQVDFRASQGQQQAAKPTIDPEQGLRVANKALAEIDNVQHTVIQMQKDLGRLKDTVGQRDAQDKEAQSRLAALEERVTTLATPPRRRRRGDGAAFEAKGGGQGQGRQAGRESSATHRASSASSRTRSRSRRPQPKPTAAPPKFETGSIPAPPPTITFGEPQVTPAQPRLHRAAWRRAVARRAAHELAALRDRHGDALGSLQPRFVAPRSGGGPYRLVAGPLPSKADADKVCAEMGIGRDSCFATTAQGQPL